MLKQACLFLLLLSLPVILLAQPQDSLVAKKDSVIKLSPAAAYDTTLTGLLKQNRFLDAMAVPVAMQNRLRKQPSDDIFFYLMAVVVSLLAFFKFFYARYFNNLFRVFFNTSLRQSQLTDQLLQAKLPSLLFNIFFALSGGIYIYLLLRHYQWLPADRIMPMLLSCIACLGLVYFVKFITLKFTGWLTGYREVTNTYLFVTFLINKIIGIFLVPFDIIIAFSAPELTKIAVIISLLLVGLMLLLRFFRSYGLLQHELKMSRSHFLIYIIGIELIPLLLIYKSLMILLSKNL